MKNIEDIIENMPVCVTVFDMEGKIVFVNKRALKKHGYSKEEVVGNTMEDTFLIEEDVPKYREAMQRLSSGEEVDSQEYRLRGKDGTTLIELVGFSLLKDDDDNDIVVATHKDISNGKKNEQDLAKVSEELESQIWGAKKTNECIKVLYNELDAKNKELEKVDQLKSQFVTNVSHELRKPLAVVKESMDIILEGVAGKINLEQKKILTSAVEAIDHLLRTVTDILDVSKIEAGTMELKKEEIDMAAMVESIVSFHKIEAIKNNVTITKEIHKDIGMIWGDKDKIREVIINLLNNAIKFTHKKGDIKIELVGSKEEVCIKVTDSGKGISEEKKEKILDKFESATDMNQEGIGLGLAIAKDIVELHKGKLWVERAAEKGSKFICCIPRNCQE